MFPKAQHVAATIMMLAMLVSCGAPGTNATPGASATATAPGAAPATVGAGVSPSVPAASATIEATVTTAVAGTTAGSEQINVVATTSIIADLAQNVGGERVNVDALLPPGADPHTYSPKPSDVQAIAHSQILFKNGLGLEAWLDEVVSNAGGSRPTMAVSEGLTPIEGEKHAEEHGDEHSEEATAEASSATAQEGGEHEHEHAADPHMWFDVQNVIGYVENIRDGLKQVDPDGAGTYDANAAAYIKQLQQLDQDITAQLESVPTERRKLVTNHDTFGYFAKRYGYKVVGSVFENVSTEQEPSAQQIAELVRALQEQNVPAVFTENTVNPRLAEQVADEAGVKVVTDLYTDALGEPGSAGDTYIKMMRHDVEQIVEALK
jgi:ABC-type Zn uptake system ZnuABC Zn-binding protein ZnuA